MTGIEHMVAQITRAARVKTPRHALTAADRRAIVASLSAGRGVRATASTLGYGYGVVQRLNKELQS